MRILVTGADGQLGRSLCRRLSVCGHEYKGVSHRELEVQNATEVKACFQEFRPEAVVHCAAFNQVDLAEVQREKCFAVNVTGSQIIAEECRRLGAYLLYISSDYVFDGRKNAPYEIGDAKNPLSVYGETKSEGENVVLFHDAQNAVIRTSWLFGESRRNFVEAILAVGGQNEVIRVVEDQIGSPTYTEDFAVRIVQIVEKRCAGIYHCTNEGACSRAEFARKILLLAGLNCSVCEISSEEYRSLAVRPKNSCLSKVCLDRVGLTRMPAWEDALARYMAYRSTWAQK